MIQQTYHPYHLVDPSPWPYAGACATAGAPPPPPPSKSEKKPVDYVEVRPQHVKPPAIQVQPPLQRSAAAVKRKYEYKTITAKYNCIHGVQRSLFVVGPHY